jgi:putative membrane protein
MKRYRLLVFLLGVAVLAGLTVYAGAGAVLRAFVALGAGGLAIAVAMHGAVIAALGLAWWAVGRGAPRKYMAARLVRDSVAEVLPFSQIGGFVVGARALHLMGFSLLSASLSMFADLVAEFAGKLPYALIGIVALVYLLPGSRLILPMSLSLAAGMGGVTLAVVYRARIMAVIEKGAAGMARKWTRLEAGEAWRQEFERVFARGRFLPSFAIHFLCWAFGTAETWVIFALMSVHVTVLEALAIDSMVSAIRTAAFLVPAAAGVQETGYVLICALTGISAAEALALSFARRARDIAIGLIGLAFWQFLEARRVEKQSA